VQRLCNGGRRFDALSRRANKIVQLKILEPTDRAPARLIIGPNRTLSDSEVETANLAFYNTLFNGPFDGFLAYKAMNDAIEPPSDTRRQLFDSTSAELMFRWVMRGYFRDQCTEQRIAALVEGQVAPLALRDNSPQFLAAMRTEMRAALTNHRKVFEDARRRFFFCDVQPENCARFNITFEDCWKDADR
jgi:hypothetical protein